MILQEPKFAWLVAIIYKGKTFPTNIPKWQHIFLSKVHVLPLTVNQMLNVCQCIILIAIILCRILPCYIPIYSGNPTRQPQFLQ